MAPTMATATTTTTASTDAKGAMAPEVFFDPNFTKADKIVLAYLTEKDGGVGGGRTREKALSALDAERKQPVAVLGTDMDCISASLRAHVVDPYVSLARRVVRHETDAVMLTHLLLYFSTSVPSAILLYARAASYPSALPLSWWAHAALHAAMQLSYIAPFTLMMHQHIHAGGLLNARFRLVDTLFPYLLCPLMGHTWHSYYYHHVRHHHVEGGGPADLSCTWRYQRDDPWHLACYVARFLMAVSFELPLHFVRKRWYAVAARQSFWEFSSLGLLAWGMYARPAPTTFVLLIPFIVLRVALMIGNWGQHSLLDHDDPVCDYGSSLTLIDVVSNRQCFNDGYHLSHHLNPLRHWRDHPMSLVKGHDTYASKQAMVLHDLDFFTVTLRLVTKDYAYLARRMVPVSAEQRAMTMEQRIALIKDRARRFTDDEIRERCKKAA